jgi:hypothetical protein
LDWRFRFSRRVDGHYDFHSRLYRHEYGGKMRNKAVLRFFCIVGLLAVAGVIGGMWDVVHGQAAIAPPPGNGWTQLTSGLATTTFTDTTCADASTCFYAVEAVDQFGASLDTTFVSVVIPTTGTHTVKVSWTASATPGATYTLFQGPSPSPAAGLAAVVN